jgi:O-succinylbenzoic acid--CoA ligase
MTRYSFHSLLINRRQIEIDHILNNTATPLSEFEMSIFSFIQKWFSTTDEFIQNTSGSTGPPKPIVITRHQMEASARLTQQALQLKSGDTALLCLDPEFIAGKMMLVRSFIADMKIIAVNPSQNPFREIPSDIPIDFTALVPFQVYELLQSGQAYRLNSIKNILVGGAPLNEYSHALLSQYSCRLYATYGMTETVSHIALRAINGSTASTYFTLLPGIKIGIDNRGCLEIEAPYLVDKITTNDLVEIIDSSHFKWLGRADNIINTGGIKIIPEKIEGKIRALLDRLKISNKILISSLPDSLLGNKVIMLVEGEIPHLLVEDLRQHLKGILSPYEIPKEFFFHVNFMLTKNGKINRFETTRQVGNKD